MQYAISFLESLKTFSSMIYLSFPKVFLQFTTGFSCMQPNFDNFRKYPKKVKHTPMLHWIESSGISSARVA